MSEIPRRNIFIFAIYALWGVISIALGIPAVLYLFVPTRLRKQQEWIDVGDVSTLVPGAPVEMAFVRSQVDGWKVVSEKATAWVVKSADNQVVAFGPRCTHLGCAYHWEENRKDFVCPCHDSFFSIEGKVKGGPAPRPLDRYETKLQGSKLLLGTLRRSSGDEV